MIEQAAIAGLGLTAVALSQARHERARRWAPIFGLASQPFWLYATWSVWQPGMFALCCAYTFVWSAGFWRQWVKR